MENNGLFLVKDDELEAVQAEADEIQNVYVYSHVLKSPFTYEEKEYDRLEFDFGKLTGRDTLAVENELQALGITVVVPELSGDYLIRLAARACTQKIGADMLIALPLQDFHQIRKRTRSFLLRSGS